MSSERLGASTNVIDLPETIYSAPMSLQDRMAASPDTLPSIAYKSSAMAQPLYPLSAGHTVEAL
jgi:hypothetical protein